jgi:hypothetical protein
MDTNREAVVHLESLAQLLKELALERIELFEHAYNPQSFGSFVLVLGRGHEQLKFIWDGKDAILSVSFAAVQNKNTAPVWTHDADLSLPKGEGLYAEIASQSVDMLAI